MVIKELKRVRKILPAQRPHWVGNGFNVFPVFANLAFSNELSPWLMFDFAAPKHFDPTSQRLGVGQHPHRGFETVTIAFQGGVEHSDSVGNRDVIGPGDVQWMTAGRGIIHEEYHSTAFAKEGGTFEMCQLWLNLPAKHKMHEPRYQPILDKDIPVVPLGIAADDGTQQCDDDDATDEAGDGAAAAPAAAGGGGGATARIIAGELAGQRGPALTFSPVELFDISLPTAGAPVTLSLPPGHNTILFVRKGALAIGPADGGADADADADAVIGPQSVALLETGGSLLRLAAREGGTQVLLLGGQPLDEPIAARGPFVMNTHEEIIQANRDFQSGRMGR